MKVRIIITGGTFDKEYDEINGNLYFNKTHMNEILSLGRSRLKVVIEPLMMIDSLDMKNSEREKILKQCIKSKEDKIVITHGTDTMSETGKVLARAGINKTIVLTGAMIPYAFGTSDGLFNIGGALAFAQCLDPGVYIAMNGIYFEWDQVKKNKKTGIFETTK
tara:strand:+ start:1634 stop:2122 length:489 start_codon:yes stop_codon:yes gene_type:complete